MTRALPLRLLRSPLLLLALGALTLSACDGNEPDPCDVPANCRPDVLVANQGNFTEANGTLAAYNPASGAVDSTAALGSLLQSVTQGPDGFFYVTANTAGRVDVFDAAAGGVPTRVGQIAVQAPRYVAFVSRQKAYVTTQLYDAPSLVTIINPQTQAATGTIEVGGFAEGITVLGDRAYVATGAFSATQEVVVIETETDAVIDRIDVGCNPRLVLSENAGIPPLPVFVVCSGAADDEIVVLNGETGAELRRISVGGAINTAGPGQDASLAFVEGALTLFVARLDGAVVRIPTASGTVMPIPIGGTPIGAVAFDPASERLYVARVPGFALGGFVTVHDLTGAETARFSSGGVAPSHFAFRPFSVN